MYVDYSVNVTYGEFSDNKTRTMVNSPQMNVEEEMEDDTSMQECTDSEVDVLLGPRSASGLSADLNAVSLEVGLSSGGVCIIIYWTPPHHQKSIFDLIKM